MAIRMSLLLPNILLSCLLAITVGCAAPAPQSADTSAAEAVEASTGVAPAPAVTTPPTPAPPISDPLPPQRTPVVEPQSAGMPVKLDTSCNVDADCAVKNVGNCCGYFPACVNRNSPTDPAAVDAQCEREGLISGCGYRDIASCGCSQGQCVPAKKTPVGGWSDDPGVPPDPVR